jgi:hypothetical protein
MKGLGVSNGGILWDSVTKATQIYLSVFSGTGKVCILLILSP